MLDAQALEIDESLLTGESDPVAKQPGDEVLSGSFAVAGHGTMRVTKVGGDAYAATLAQEASRFTMVHSQIRADINRVLRLVTFASSPSRSSSPSPSCSTTSRQPTPSAGRSPE